MGLVIGIVVGIILVISIPAVIVFNALTRSKNDVEKAFADIDVYLKKRYDLIPNLVNTVKGYAKHEKDIFSEVTNLRSSALNSASINEKVEINNKLASSIRSMMAVAENYPDLKANENFLSLQKSLSDIESEISSMRIAYNQKVTNHNTKLATFPNNLFSKLFSFKKFDLFTADEKERENVKVEF